MARSWMVKAIAGGVITAVLGPLAVPVAFAEDSGESPGAAAAYAAATVGLTVAHVPSKLTMCSVSVVLGGFAYLLTFGRPSVAKDVADTVKGVCGGPYIITPAKLETDTKGPDGAD